MNNICLLLNYMDVGNINLCYSDKQNGVRGSCFSLDDLRTLAGFYNDSGAKDKIDIEKGGEEYLLKELTTKLGKDCPGSKKENKHLCWVRQKWVEKDFGEKIFKPYLSARKEGEWLSNFDIQNAFDGYKRFYPNFTFMGAVPCDAINYTDISQYEGIRNHEKYKTPKKGVIFNLDTHKQSGSHWVGVFIYDRTKYKEIPVHEKDNNDYEIFYFDSNGGNCDNKYINEFIKIYKDKGYKYYYNKKKIQKDGSECGVYSIQFLFKMNNNTMNKNKDNYLSNKNKFIDLIVNSMPYKDISACRKDYYR